MPNSVTVSDPGNYNTIVYVNGTLTVDTGELDHHGRFRQQELWRDLARHVIHVLHPG